MNSATEYVRVITGVGKCNRSAAASSSVFACGPAYLECIQKHGRWFWVAANGTPLTGEKEASPGEWRLPGCVAACLPVCH